MDYVREFMQLLRRTFKTEKAERQIPIQTSIPWSLVLVKVGLTMKRGGHTEDTIYSLYRLHR